MRVTREAKGMMSPLLFAVYVTAFVVVLYAVEHFVSTHWSALVSLDRDELGATHRSNSDGQDRR
jgi:hypothetical protein